MYNIHIHTHYVCVYIDIYINTRKMSNISRQDPEVWPGLATSVRESQDDDDDDDDYYDDDDDDDNDDDDDDDFDIFSKPYKKP